MFRALPVLLAVFVIACRQVPIEGVTLEAASQASGPDRESEGNLAAIKALLVRERQQFHAGSRRSIEQASRHYNPGRPTMPVLHLSLQRQLRKRSQPVTSSTGCIWLLIQG